MASTSKMSSDQRESNAEDTKLNIVLDLDQTLISAEATEDFDIKKNKKKMKNFSYHDMDGYYIVFERPNLQNFLDYLFENFNVSIWTAASKDYCLFIVDKIILQNHPERKIDYIFFKYHCDYSSDKKSGTKDLSMLWDIYNIKGYNKNNTIILDDYDEVCDTQPENCIMAKPFEFNSDGSDKDDFLVVLMDKLRKLKDDVNSGKSLGAEIKKINKE